MVTGIAAILKALEPEYQQHKPGLVMSPAEIKSVLVKSADAINTGEPDKRLGSGCYGETSSSTGCRLNAHRAVAWYFPPVGVINLSATAESADSIRLTWQKPADFDLKNPDFDSYRIFRGTAPGVPTGGTPVKVITDPNTLSFTDSGLSPGTRHFYKVVVADKAGLRSPESNEADAFTQTGFSIYDFAADFFSLNGNIASVPGCTQGRGGQTVSFFDEFNDNRVDQGCTANLRQHGVFEESGGLLRLRSERGVLRDGSVTHTAEFDQRIRDGGGDLDYIVSFRPDLPSPFPDFSAYGILLIDDFDPPFFEALALQVQPGGPGRNRLVAFRSSPVSPPVITAFAPIDLPSLSRIVLKLRFDDAANRVFPSFSTDGGITFSSMKNPDGSTFSIPAFTVPGQTEGVVQMFAAARVPQETLSLQALPAAPQTEGPALVPHAPLFLLEGE